MRKALATRTGSAWFFAKPASDSQYSLYTFSGREMIGLFSPPRRLVHTVHDACARATQ